MTFHPVHAAAASLACIYLTAVFCQWQVVKYALKPTVTLLIAYPTYNTWHIFLGLLFSALGDAFLMLPSEQMFVPGLLSFLIAHIFYIASFDTPTRVSWPAVPLVLFAAAMLHGLWPGVANEDTVVQIGVVVYVFAIVWMTYKASLTGNMVLATGTVLFCVSDSVLAWSKFIQSYEWSEFVVMLTYYAA
ncbi:hypothetical protein EV181_002048, partial [Coemansia sp. RSA 532]